MFLPGKQTEAVHIAGAGRGLWGIAGRARRRCRRRRRRRLATPASTPSGAGLRRQGRPQLAPASRSTELPTDRNPATRQGLHRLPERRHRQGHPPRGPRGHASSIEHIKRYTTNGMATDQGKMSNINGLAIAADALGKPPPQVGLTTFRPPYTPTTFGAFAGYHRRRPFEVTRKTPIDAWAEENGAVFEPVSLWRRAWYFPQGGRGHARRRWPANAGRPAPRSASSTPRPSARSRSSGPTRPSSWSGCTPTPGPSSASGRCRYGLLLGEDGFIRDDGVIGRLAAGPLPRHHHDRRCRARAQHDGGLSADRVAGPEGLADLHHRAVGVDRAATGPNARKLIEPLVEGIDLSDEAFPHMSVAECTIAGLPARLFRVSFTGELGFEVNVPGALRPRPLGRSSARPGSGTTSRPTAPRPCTCCAPRRATSSSARTPTAP